MTEYCLQLGNINNKKQIIIAKLVFIVGPTGSGKSTGIRNLDPKTTVLMNSDQKDLPFRQFGKSYNKEMKNYKKSSDLKVIKKLMLKLNEPENAHVETAIVDTFTRVMTDYVMNNKFRSSTGFEKWGNLSGDIYDFINMINEVLRDDLIVYLFCHPEVIIDENGRQYSRIAVQG